MITLTALCRELKNYFTQDDDKHFGEFVITNGAIDLSNLVNSGSLQSGQYFRIVGSVSNDGVYRYPVTGLTDETFEGAIWSMKGEGLSAALALLDDINTWENKYHGEGSNIDSPYVSESESFGGYSRSYTKATGGNSSASGASADAGTWQNQFHSRLNSLRKIRV